MLYNLAHNCTIIPDNIHYEMYLPWIMGKGVRNDRSRNVYKIFKDMLD